MTEENNKDMGRIWFADETVEPLDKTQLNRVVYALTTLALHAAIEHVHIREVINGKGEVLWRHPSYREIAGYS